MSRALLKDVRFLGWMACAAILLIAVHQAIEKPRPVDFTYFYSVGHILNQYMPVQLYDAKLQQETFNRVWPLKAGEGIYGPSPYPPFVAMLFQPFAKLAFWTAFRLWVFRIRNSLPDRTTSARQEIFSGRHAAAVCSLLLRTDLLASHHTHPAERPTFLDRIPGDRLRDLSGRLRPSLSQRNLPRSLQL